MSAVDEVQAPEITVVHGWPTPAELTVAAAVLLAARSVDAAAVPDIKSIVDTNQHAGTEVERA